LGRALRGETNATGSFNDASFDEDVTLYGPAVLPLATVVFHINRALSAAIFGDEANLDKHSMAAIPLMPFIKGIYCTVPGYLLPSLALANRIRQAPLEERASLLTELDTHRDWMAKRAADAPINFSHLVHFIEAERAWALDDFQGALTAFDTALDELHTRQRPWHKALITERAAHFQREHGLEYSGRRLLVEAKEAYAAWGATAKVQQMEQEHPFLRVTNNAENSARISLEGQSKTLHSTAAHSSAVRGTDIFSSDAIDLLAVLKASQVLSSQTSLDQLQIQLAEVLSAMTGATTVQMLIWNEETKEWSLPSSATDLGAPLAVEAAGARGLLPLSAFRYAERTLQPLLVEDATRDDRFARDPYFTDKEQCSLMLAPILSQGQLRAILYLENSLSSGAFSHDRLDTVLLIAGQLTVSLDNALLYASLVQANVKAEGAREEAERANAAKSEFLSRMSHELRTPLNAILGFGQILERQEGLTPIQAESAEHILKGGRHLLGLVNEVLDITMAESGQMSLSLQPVAAKEIVGEVLQMIRPLAQQQNIGLEGCDSSEGCESSACDYRIIADRQRLQQVLFNLISNAVKFNGETGRVTVSCSPGETGSEGAGHLEIAVSDTGPGISEEKLHRLFTPFDRLDAEKRGIAGTGLGLVISKRLVEAMNGSLSVQSTPGQGTTFTIKLPMAAD
jgi:signal transduction histidine kinase